MDVVRAGHTALTLAAAELSTRRRATDAPRPPCCGDCGRWRRWNITCGDSESDRYGEARTPWARACDAFRPESAEGRT